MFNVRTLIVLDCLINRRLTRPSEVRSVGLMMHVWVSETISLELSLQNKQIQIFHSDHCWSIPPRPASLFPRHASSSSLPNRYWSHFKTAPLNLFPIICCLWFLFWTKVSPPIRSTFLGFLLSSLLSSLAPCLGDEILVADCCCFFVFGLLWLQMCQKQSWLSLFPKCLKSITGGKNH